MFVHFLTAICLTMGILSVLVAIGLCWLILFPEYPKHRY
nr:MAG TPA: hypothetical protein [Caudoviricetes sp.]